VNPTEIQGRALVLLAGLGDTPDLIAGSLVRAGVTGVPGSSCGCPIANYLTTQLDEVEEVNVSPEAMFLHLAGGGTVELDTPRPVGQFMAAFDLGHYEALIDNGGEGGNKVTTGGSGRS
jgi:hypothetical protein